MKEMIQCGGCLWICLILFLAKAFRAQAVRGNLDLFLRGGRVMKENAKGSSYPNEKTLVIDISNVPS